jgi:hypothetical protein
MPLFCSDCGSAFAQSDQFCVGCGRPRLAQRQEVISELAVGPLRMQNSQTFKNIFREFFELVRKPAQIERLNDLLLDIQIEILFGIQLTDHSGIQQNPTFDSDYDWSPKLITQTFDDSKFRTTWIDPETQERECSEETIVSIRDLKNLRSPFLIPIDLPCATHVLMNPVRDEDLSSRVVDAIFPGALGLLVPGNRLSDLKRKFSDRRAQTFTSYVEMPREGAKSVTLELVANGFDIEPRIVAK